jgi:hypothetical protein
VNVSHGGKFSSHTELFSIAHFHIILQGQYLSWKIQKAFHNIHKTSNLLQVSYRVEQTKRTFFI